MARGRSYAARKRTAERRRATRQRKADASRRRSATRKRAAKIVSKAKAAGISTRSYIKRSRSKSKRQVTKVIKDAVKPAATKKPFITPKTPAIISQQIGKINRIPLLIIGVVVVVYAIIKKVLK